MSPARQGPGPWGGLPMRCTRCGSELPAQSRFCLSCGQPVAAAGATQQVPQSGTPTGSPYGPTGAYAPQYTAPYPPPTQNRRLVWPLIVCVVVILLAAVAVG